MINEFKDADLINFHIWINFSYKNTGAYIANCPADDTQGQTE